MHRNYAYILHQTIAIAYVLREIQEYAKTCPDDDDGMIIKGLSEELVDFLGSACDGGQYRGRIPIVLGEGQMDGF